MKALSALGCAAVSSNLSTPAVSCSPTVVKFYQSADRATVRNVELETIILSLPELNNDLSASLHEDALKRQPSSIERQQ